MLKVRLGYRNFFFLLGVLFSATSLLQATQSKEVEEVEIDTEEFLGRSYESLSKKFTRKFRNPATHTSLLEDKILPQKDRQSVLINDDQSVIVVVPQKEGKNDLKTALLVYAYIDFLRVRENFPIGADFSTGYYDRLYVYPQGEEEVSTLSLIPTKKEEETNWNNLWGVTSGHKILRFGYTHSLKDNPPTYWCNSFYHVARLMVYLHLCDKLLIRSLETNDSGYDSEGLWKVLDAISIGTAGSLMSSFIPPKYLPWDGLPTSAVSNKWDKMIIKIDTPKIKISKTIQRPDDGTKALADSLITIGRVASKRDIRANPKIPYEGYYYPINMGGTSLLRSWSSILQNSLYDAIRYFPKILKPTNSILSFSKFYLEGPYCNFALSNLNPQNFLFFLYPFTCELYQLSRNGMLVNGQHDAALVEAVYQEGESLVPKSPIDPEKLGRPSYQKHVKIDLMIGKTFHGYGLKKTPNLDLLNLSNPLVVRSVEGSKVISQMEQQRVLTREKGRDFFMILPYGSVNEDTKKIPPDLWWVYSCISHVLDFQLNYGSRMTDAFKKLTGLNDKLYIYPHGNEGETHVYLNTLEETFFSEEGYTSIKFHSTDSTDPLYHNFSYVMAVVTHARLLDLLLTEKKLDWYQYSNTKAIVTAVASVTPVLCTYSLFQTDAFPGGIHESILKDSWKHSFSLKLGETKISFQEPTQAARDLASILLRIINEAAEGDRNSQVEYMGKYTHEASLLRLMQAFLFTSLVKYPKSKITDITLQSYLLNLADYFKRAAYNNEGPLYTLYNRIVQEAQILKPQSQFSVQELAKRG